MSKFRTSLERVTRLTPSRGALENHVSQIRIGGASTSQIVLLPYSQGLGYFIVPTGGPIRSIEGEDFRAERLGRLLTLWVRLRLALIFKKKKYLEFQEFTLFCYGVKPERKRFTTFNQHMFNTGVALDGRLVTAHPELLQGWSPIESDRRPPAAASRPAAAIVAHIYYDDTWPEIANVLKRLTIPFDLIVTTVTGRDLLVAAAHRDFPDAEVVMTENRGRDVRPFLELLEAGRLDRYRYVCKIHGKKSNDGGRISYLGALWRRRSLFDLLAGAGIAELIVRAFEADPSVGIIGPRAFRLPSKTSPLEPSWARPGRKCWSSPRKWASPRVTSASTSTAEPCSGFGRKRCGRSGTSNCPAPSPRRKDCWTGAWSMQPSACSRPRPSSPALSLRTVTATK